MTGWLNPAPVCTVKRTSIVPAIGFIPVSFRDLSSPDGYGLRVDGAVFDQSVHGRDFWQSGYDPATRTWIRTYNLPSTEKGKTLLAELVHLH